MRKLKPCPFCGSEGVRGGVGVTHHTQCKNRKCPAYAGSYHKTREDSDDVWNKRVLPLSVTLPDDPPNEALERVKENTEWIKSMKWVRHNAIETKELVARAEKIQADCEQAIKAERERMIGKLCELRSAMAAWVCRSDFIADPRTISEVTLELNLIIKSIKGGEK